MGKKDIKRLGLSALFIAMGIVLPFFTGQIPRVGNMMLPMHIPVFICGFLCGWKYGLIVGFTLPLLRSVIFGMPVLYPAAIAMSMELATYGLVCGLLYVLSKKKSIMSIYVSLIVAMVLGRVVWGISEVILLGIKGNTFSYQMFIGGAFLNAIPGIVLQLVLIPIVVKKVRGIWKY
ncbi:MAG: ECF transporter S component [Lachnospiraceae bacterium]|nr:ECF transporter S component [Lachnospiraceae bacterium]